MWHQTDDDVQVIEISNEIELLPNDRKPFLNEELCKDVLSKVKENVSILHLQTVKDRLNSNLPEVDVEYRVTNGSLNNDLSSKFAIENVEIKKKIKQENENEIQDSVIKIQNNNLRLIAEKSMDSMSDRLNSLNLKQAPSYNHFLQQHSNNDATNSIDIHPTGHRSTKPLNYSSNDKVERELLKRYLEDSALEYHIKPTVKTDANKRFQSNVIYPISSRPRGYCLIINNVDFMVYERRRGSDLEAEYLKEIFTQLGFEILYYRNLSSLGMLECFKNVLRRPELERHDAFVSIILTHGDDNKVLIGVDANRLKLDSLLHYFTDSNCPQLANKPKVFFIQACRGTNHDFGNYDQITVSDAVPVRASNAKVRKEIKELNGLNDVLIVNSTLEGFVSLRNEISGSWFGDALGIALCEHAKDMDLQNLLLFVNRKIIEREKGDVQQAVEINYISFRKGFYFNPGHYFEKKSNS